MCVLKTKRKLCVCVCVCVCVWLLLLLCVYVCVVVGCRYQPIPNRAQCKRARGVGRGTRGLGGMEDARTCGISGWSVPTHAMSSPGIPYLYLLVTFHTPALVINQPTLRPRPSLHPASTPCSSIPAPAPSLPPLHPCRQHPPLPASLSLVVVVGCAQLGNGAAAQREVHPRLDGQAVVGVHEALQGSDEAPRVCGVGGRGSGWVGGRWEREERARQWG